MHTTEYNSINKGCLNLKQAAVTALQRELWIVLQAAHQMAAQRGLLWDDYDRIHEAHQHILRVLEEVVE